jgi:hypothetical protein
MNGDIGWAMTLRRAPMLCFLLLVVVLVVCIHLFALCVNFIAPCV